MYEHRPGGCRVYACAWKLGLADPEHRPDRIGGLLEWLELDRELHPFGGSWLLRQVGDSLTPEGIELVECLRSIGCIVTVYRGPRRRLTVLYPDGGSDDKAGTAPSWEDEVAGRAAMDFRVAYYSSYADRLDPELRAQIETGELPFVEP